MGISPVELIITMEKKRRASGAFSPHFLINKLGGGSCRHHSPRLSDQVRAALPSHLQKAFSFFKETNLLCVCLFSEAHIRKNLTTRGRMPSQLEGAMDALITVFYNYSGNDGDKYKLNKGELKELLNSELTDFLTVKDEIPFIPII